MTELDAELPKVVLELIEEFGKLVQYGTVNAGEYNVETGSSAPVSDIKGIKALIGEYGEQAFLSNVIEKGDKQLFIAALSFPDDEPTPGDKVEFDGKTFTVMNAKATYSGELIALYEVQIRL